ncbi:MAG TPA: hypothetical protein VJN62_04605 [Gemmatimonadales bacterium]|nr:hypothetical protein [Gemmatimonadales bacterium]
MPLLRVPEIARTQTMQFAVTAGVDTSPARAPVGTWRLEYRAQTLAGRRGITYVAQFAFPNGRNVTDSVSVLADGLTPVSERSHQPTKEMDLQFAEDSVVAEVTDSAGVRRVTTRTRPPYFNSTDTPLVALALAASPGVQGVIREYTYEAGGLVDDTVSVQPVSPGLTKVRSATAGAVWIWEIDTHAHAILRATRRGRSSAAFLEFTRTDLH